MKNQLSTTKIEDLFHHYQQLQNNYDEYFTNSPLEKTMINDAIKMISEISLEQWIKYQELVDIAFRKRGVTFKVEGDAEGIEKTFPFDLLPRMISAKEWSSLKKGLIQRVNALNAFLNDCYGSQKIIEDKIIPKEVIYSSPNFLQKMHGITPPHGVYIHIAGIDLIRGLDGEFLVLEDNVRCPSGVSYVLENRFMSGKLLSHVMSRLPIASVEDYPLQLRRSLCEISQAKDSSGICVVLTPGPYNSAYFEHVFLARNMGFELVQAHDLFVENDYVYLKTTEGIQRVDVLYRRINDDYIDPLEFIKDSTIGVPGIVKAYAKGNIVVANAIGNGVADDKAIYSYVPDIIRYYLSEEPIIKQVPTYRCHFEEERKHVLANLDNFVIKNVQESGGFDMLMGPFASKNELENYKQKIIANPRLYIAQPLIELSASPTILDGKITPKRVDFRPYILTGKTNWVLNGGLTRVALKEGSYVVNSCQGGGSKDTWVLNDEGKS